MLADREFQPTRTPFDLSRYQTSYEIGRAAVVRRLIPAGRGGSALDIGCGPGYYTRMLSEKGWRTTAIDTDPQNIESARSHADETRVGDAAGLLASLPESGFELALALEIIEHMPKAHGGELLKNIARTLKPDGLLLLSTPNRFSIEGLSGSWGEKMAGWKKWDAWDQTHVHIYSSHEILTLLKLSGFFIRRVIGVHYKGHFPLIGSWGLPLNASGTFPLNRLGFNIIVECGKR